MRSLILAAGQGKRLGKVSKNKPKCLVNLFGKSLLETQIDVLKSANINDISIVSGFKSELLNDFDLKKYHNKDFESTNMVASMFVADDLFSNSEDLIISYGDIIYEKKNLEKLITNDSEVSIMVDLNWKNLWSIRFEDPLSDAETMKFDKELNISELGNKTTNYYDINGQYTGLIKFRKDVLYKIYNTYKLFKESSPDNYQNIYMTDFIQILIEKQIEVKASLVRGGWLEIDTESDLIKYKNLEKNGKLNTFYNR
ncbi:MAG: nucleotidyl transferase [Candidatus Marinimicrobia bacterium]|nr:nucleotidyl transferase [Candidatus Neomarinimicrobiota bacterium]|tara:strand:+ start:1799 stop:2563 length:765 start_codon:yes stop_codon:yes gene_type:complete